MRYRQRASVADPASELFQTLCYLPHQRQTLLLGSENLWALDMRVREIFSCRDIKSHELPSICSSPGLDASVAAVVMRISDTVRIAEEE